LIKRDSSKKFYLFLTVFIIAIFISYNIYADTTYTIKKGDNPSRIAKKFKVNVQDIVKNNNLSSNNLKPGTKITIPSKGKGSIHINKINPPSTPFSKGELGEFSGDNIKTVKRREDNLYHLVKKGDSLFCIARKYSISVNELKEINNLRTTKLKPGQELIVKQIGPKSYTVRKGDNIYKIVRRFNIDIDELRDINSLETDLLKPGQKILLEPEIEPDEPKNDGIKNYEAILSQAGTDEEIKKLSAAEELSKMGLRERLILFANKLLNIPYRFGGSSLLGIDCSAYVQKVYSLIGIDLPRSARKQFQEGTPVNDDELSIGDLVFFRTYASFPSHVGIYLGNNLFIHASSRSKKVTIDSLETPFYLKRFIGAKRLIEAVDGKKGETQSEGIPNPHILPSPYPKYHILPDFLPVS
jgi:cell wall-associated NlpC family hydrolase